MTEILIQPTNTATATAGRPTPRSRSDFLWRNFVPFYSLGFDPEVAYCNVVSIGIFTSVRSMGDTP